YQKQLVTKALETNLLLDPEVAAIQIVANRCSAYVADGTSEIDTTLENVRAGLALTQLSTALIEDSLQSTARVRLRPFKASVTLINADTVYFAMVTGEGVVINRIVAVVTTAGTGAQNMQLTTQGNDASATETSLGADIDMNTPAAGATVRWDLSNFTNAPVATAIGVPVAAGDIYEESCEVPANTRIGMETGETPGVYCIMDVTIWYSTDGTGIIAAP
ncbi:hypothetical protein LCGC14_2307550, partial [marine sediment metagenome]